MRWPVAVILLLWAGVVRAESDGERVDKLERENADLRDRVERLEGQDRADLEEIIETYLSTRESETAADEGGLGLNLVIRTGNVRGQFQLFGDSGFRFDNPQVTGRSNTFFFNGGFDLFFTARAGDHFHVLTETVFLTSLGEPRDGGHFDQERLWAAWSFSDAVQIKFGLEHGPISRWNNLYHHGRWLEVTIDRPLVARFEGGGGILPMHNAGIEVSGRIRTERGTLEYVVIVSNGRGRVPTDTQEFSDRNDGKAFDFGAGFRPARISGLWVGVFFRIDDIPPNPSDPDRLRSIRELIGSFQVDYRCEKFEILFEIASIRNKDRQSGLDFDHLAGYLQIASHHNDEWTPYFRVDFRQMDRGDPYFAPLDRDLDVLEVLFGVRHDFIENASLKFEVGFGEAQSRDASGIVSTGSFVRFGIQLAWVF